MIDECLRSMKKLKDKLDFASLAHLMIQFRDRMNELMVSDPKNINQIDIAHVESQFI